MPMYDFECHTCEHVFDEMVKLADFDKPQACPKCESSESTQRIISAVSFNLTGDGWAGKNNRVKGQMREKNKRLEAKEREMKGDGMIPSLAPNVDGQRVDSWSEAKRLAKSKGKNTSGYDRYIRKD